MLAYGMCAVRCRTLAGIQIKRRFRKYGKNDNQTLEAKMTIVKLYRVDMKFAILNAPPPFLTISIVPILANP